MAVSPARLARTEDGTKYEFTAEFPHDGETAALGRRFAAVFRKPMFRGAVWQPRSGRVAPTREAIAALVVPPPPVIRGVHTILKGTGVALPIQCPFPFSRVRSA